VWTDVFRRHTRPHRRIHLLPTLFVMWFWHAEQVCHLPAMSRTILLLLLLLFIFYRTMLRIVQYYLGKSVGLSVFALRRPQRCGSTPRGTLQNFGGKSGFRCTKALISLKYGKLGGPRLLLMTIKKSYMWFQNQALISSLSWVEFNWVEIWAAFLQSTLKSPVADWTGDWSSVSVNDPK